MPGTSVRVLVRVSVRVLVRVPPHCAGSRAGVGAGPCAGLGIHPLSSGAFVGGGCTGLRFRFVVGAQGFLKISCYARKEPESLEFLGCSSTHPTKRLWGVGFGDDQTHLGSIEIIGKRS